MAEASPSASGGYRYSTEHRCWLVVEAAGASTDPTTLDRPLRLATLNCLHDLSLPDVLQHDVRHESICRELESLDADILGLNEVTAPLLERLLREEWVRRSYTASVAPNDARCAHVTTLTRFGNLLLSRVRPASVEYIDQPGDGRQSHVMSLRLCGRRGGEPLSVAVCSTHLTACPWLMEGRRKVQLAHLASALAARSDGSSSSSSSSACVVMGDFNFHREAENASIPDGWGEVPAVVALGATWDFGRNAMLAHYLPVHNIYNGLGLGAGLGWPSPMRLDRVLVRASGQLGLAAATARIFADQPIHERARGRPPLPQAGPELRAAHRAVPWQEYLHPSDHFGICVELPLT